MIDRKNKKGKQKPPAEPKGSRLLKGLPLIGRTTRDGKPFISMRLKFVFVMLITAAAVTLFALIAIPTALQIFRTVNTKPERVEERLDSYVRSFAEYVAEENIRADDAKAVVAWTRRHHSVFLTVFNSSDEQFGAAGGELWEGGEQPDMVPFFHKVMDEESTGEPSMVYVVLFANGIHNVAVVDYSLATGTDAVIIIGVLTALFLFFIVLMLYYHRQTRAIVLLSHDVEAISGGDLDATIGTGRRDEIGKLAEDVDVMRNTILEKMAEQDRAWQANSDLLTSMTHDIRTPLTTLLGYMEILGADNANLTEEQKSYVSVCTRKAEQIKELSDKLFLYFWAFNRAETENASEFETYEAGLLLEQLIGDYIPAMEAVGLCISADLSAIRPSDTVRVHLDCLRRVTDNVFDNMTKYADRAAPVTIRAVREKGFITVSFTNNVKARAETPAGTHIGVKTCVNMMHMMAGRFETVTDGQSFTASMSLPWA